jgi:hypothetical protein
MYHELVIIDDLRTHTRGGLHLRTSADALDWLDSHRGDTIGELWLDHDLGGDDTIRPIVGALEERCFNRDPVPIDVIYVHTANPVGADMILRSRLLGENYRLVRTGLDEFIGDVGH